MPSRWGVVQQRGYGEERTIEPCRCLHGQSIIVHVILFPCHGEVEQGYQFAN